MPKIWIGGKMYYVDDDEIQEYIEELEEAIRDVCNLINKKGTVSKWKIFNWLNKALKGK